MCGISRATSRILRPAGAKARTPPATLPSAPLVSAKPSSPLVASRPASQHAPRQAAQPSHQHFPPQQSGPAQRLPTPPAQSPPSSASGAGQLRRGSTGAGDGAAPQGPPPSFEIRGTAASGAMLPGFSSGKLAAELDGIPLEGWGVRPGSAAFLGFPKQQLESTGLAVRQDHSAAADTPTERPEGAEVLEAVAPHESPAVAGSLGGFSDGAVNPAGVGKPQGGGGRAVAAATAGSAGEQAAERDAGDRGKAKVEEALAEAEAAEAAAAAAEASSVGIAAEQSVEEQDEQATKRLLEQGGVGAEEQPAGEEAALGGADEDETPGAV